MSFRVRLMITFSLLISLTFGIGSTLLISTSFESVLEEKKNSMVGEFETLQNNLVMLMSFSNSNDYTNLYELLYQMEFQNNAHWEAVSLRSENTMIYENGDSKLLSFNLPLKDSDTYVYVHAMEGEGAHLQMYSELSVGQELLYLKASYDLSSAYELREQQQTMFWFIYGIVIIMSIGIASVISCFMTKRLKMLADTAQTIAEGDFSVRTRLKTGDEFEQLSIVFDQMTDRLAQIIETLEDDVERKEAFMGAVAHELKTPMTSILGYADMIRQCSLDEKEQMMAANYIYMEGKRLENLSHKILELLLLEKDTFHMKKVSMDTFLKDVIDTFRPLAEKRGIHLCLDCEGFALPLEVDLAKSLFYNLVDNGMKAISDGGKVCVRGRKIPNGYEVQIIDTGCGMEAKELDRITEVFYRVDKSRSRQQGGVGLGLALCKRIVDLHHGSMEFQSQVGKGSCVTIQLPNQEA